MYEHNERRQWDLRERGEIAELNVAVARHTSQHAPNDGFAVRVKDRVVEVRVVESRSG